MKKDALKNVNATAGAQTVKLNKTVADLKKVVDALAGANDSYGDLVLETVEQQEKLAALEVEYKEKERSLAADLALKGREDEARLVADVLRKAGKVAVEISENEDTQKELAELKTNMADEVSKEVGKAVGMAKSKTDSMIREKELEYKALTATDKANLSILNDKIKFLESQVGEYKEQIKDERTARVAEAESRSKSGIVVNTSGK